jgi:peptidoglycan/LPS O-acetylase OafA/YrhL
MPSVDRQGHIVELQSIRGIAAAVVMLGHIAAAYDVTILSPIWVWTLNAHAAVVIFFVLSGFVLTRSIMNRPTDLLRFYTRRIFRLYPAMFAATAIAIVTLALLQKYEPLPYVSALFQSENQVHADFLHFAAVALGIGHAALPPMWSITVELAGSAILPFIVLTYARKRPLFWVLGLLLLAMSLATQFYLQAITATYLVDFWIGAFIALYPASAPIWKPVLRFPLPVALLAVAILLEFRIFHAWAYDAPVPNLIEAIAAAALIGAIVHGGLEIKWLKWTPVEYLGDISYSLYLVHWSVIRVGVVAIPAMFGANLGSASSHAALWVFASLSSILLAAAGYEWIEKPGIAMGQRVLKRTTQPSEGITAGDLPVTVTSDASRN